MEDSDSAPPGSDEEQGADAEREAKGARLRAALQYTVGEIIREQSETLCSAGIDVCLVEPAAH